MNKSVFVVGLDGATWKVITPLIRKGKVTFLKSLKEKGTSGILHSTIPPLTGPAWVSFQTGVNPGKHGVSGFIDYRRKEGTPKLYDSKSIKRETIWETLGKHSLKSLIINMPMSYPLRKINGIIISSFLTPKDANYVYPKKYDRELEKLDYEVDLLVENKFGELPSWPLTAKEKKHYLDKLLSIAKKRVDAFKYLSKEDDFSFNFLLFKETDLAQHLFWKTKFLEDFYQKLDSLLEELFNTFNKSYKGEKYFIVISDHGFHSAPSNEFAPYPWLRKNGYLEEGTIGSTLYEKLSNVNKKLKKLGLSPARIKLLKLQKNKLLAKKRELEAKKQGILVTPEGLYIFEKSSKIRKSQIEKMIRSLEELRFRKIPIFKVVERASQVYSGPYVKHGPGIVWMPSENFSINTSPYEKSMFTKRERILLGEHNSDPKGIFLANGSLFPQIMNQKLNIYDINPLIQYLLDVEIRGGLDGKLPAFVNLTDKISNSRKFVEEMIAAEINKLQKYE